MIGLSRTTAQAMRMTPANWTGAPVTVLLPVKGQNTGNGFVHSVQCAIPTLASAQAKWQARLDAMAQGQLLNGSRLLFRYDSSEFMNTVGGTLSILVEIADPGQGNWRTYAQSTHESGLLQKASNPQDPQTWTAPGVIPDLWDGEPYDIRITTTCSLDTTAGLQHEVI